ncbi:hypothetical protein TWF696_000777 [Orbilia brochopaga]
MEHDPATAPQLAAPSSTEPSMSYQSGAVPDHYESYPEVMPAQASNYPAAPTGVSYDGGYQAPPPPPVPQGQPVVQPQGSYFDGPIAVEGEKTYYQPVYGVSQPPPQGAPYGAPNYNIAAPPGAPPPAKQDALPPLAAYNAPPAEKKILGMRRKIFWIVLVILVIVLAAAVVGGVVGGILSKNKNNDNNNNGQVAPNTVTGADGTDNGTSTSTNRTGTSTGYVPYALTTGVRTLNLRYAESTGSCNDPQHADGGAAVNCHATSQYQVRVDGSVRNGYTLSSVNVDGSAFNNIPGTPPTTSDPNANGSAWIFVVNFSQSGACGLLRTTRYAFGQQDNNYAVGEIFELAEQCLFSNGTSFPSGTRCTCVGLSTTATSS